MVKKNSGETRSVPKNRRKKNSSDMDIYSGDTRSVPKNRRKKNSSDMDIYSGETRSVPKKASTAPKPQEKNKKRKRQKTSEEKITIRPKSSNKAPKKKARLSLSPVKGNVFQIEITNPNFSGSKHRGTVDCVICTLEALGILSLSQGQQQRKYLNNEGVYDEAIFNLLKTKYPGKKWKFERVDYEQLKSFLDEIRPFHAIYAKLRGPVMSHAVVFYKSRNNELGLADFQMDPLLNIEGYEVIKEFYLKKYELEEKFFEVLTYEYVKN